MEPQTPLDHKPDFPRFTNNCLGRNASQSIHESWYIALWTAYGKFIYRVVRQSAEKVIGKTSRRVFYHFWFFIENIANRGIKNGDNIGLLRREWLFPIFIDWSKPKLWFSWFLGFGDMYTTPKTIIREFIFWWRIPNNRIKIWNHFDYFWDIWESQKSKNCKSVLEIHWGPSNQISKTLNMWSISSKKKWNGNMISRLKELLCFASCPLGNWVVLFAISLPFECVFQFSICVKWLTNIKNDINIVLVN